jgi:putative flippase GtrA
MNPVETRSQLRPPADSGIIPRLAKFAVVGATGTVVYYATLWPAVEILQLSVLLASSLSFFIVTLENYVLHYVWTFGSITPHRTALPRFVLMNAVGFGLNWGTMYLGVETLSLNYLLVQGIAIIIVVSWNFVVSSLWIFGSRRIARKRSDAPLERAAP